MPYGPHVVALITQLCESDPEREVCGFVIRRGDDLEVVAVPNAADRYHVRDPAHFPRTSHDSYLMEPRAQLRVLEELETAGGAVVAVWHSHIEVGAYFSDKDRADAVIDGVQQVPGAEYLVFGVRRGRVAEAKRFRFDGEAFTEFPLPL